MSGRGGVIFGESRRYFTSAMSRDVTQRSDLGGQTE